MTNKEVLEQYIPAIVECRVLEKELFGLRGKGLEYVLDAVSGCPDYPPYGVRSVSIGGVVQDAEIQSQVKEIEKLVDAQRVQVIDIRLKAERILHSVGDTIVRTILRYKYIEGMEWQDVADRMTEESKGKVYTEDSVRKRAERYLDKIC